MRTLCSFLIDKMLIICYNVFKVGGNMDTLILVLIGIIVVICIIVGVIINYYNKLQDYVIRINEVETLLDNNLREKYDNINKCVSIIKNTDSITEELDKNMFEEIVKLRTRKISNFDLDRKLIVANDNFIILKEKYKELKTNKEIINITKKIEELDENIIVNRDYYNKNIAEYNKLVAIFPTNIIAKACKYDPKLYYDKKDMSDDDFNDFKL